MRRGAESGPRGIGEGAESTKCDKTRGLPRPKNGAKALQKRHFSFLPFATLHQRLASPETINKSGSTLSLVPLRERQRPLGTRDVTTPYY